ncbi:MAG: TetR family transcriptional regulator [Candidatus Eremiobacteraeota bacterium]|nr:TetR family transcriptional regulator [Candidatus Eremiobacteraeota bacterium]
MGRPAMSARAPFDVDAVAAAAMDVFLRRGYAATSMDQIAETLGIRKASLYHHVASKEELLRRGVERAFDALTAVFDEPSARHGRAIDRLRYVLTRIAEVTLARAAEASLVIRTRGNTPFEEAIIHRRRAIDAAFAALVGAAADEGTLRADMPPALLARMMLGTTNALTEWYRADGVLTAAEIAQAVAAMLLDGARAPSAISAAAAPPRRGRRVRRG